MLFYGVVLLQQLGRDAGFFAGGNGTLGIQGSLLRFQLLVIAHLQLIELLLGLGRLMTDGALLVVVIRGILDNTAHFLFVGADGFPGAC